MMRNVPRRLAPTTSTLHALCHSTSSPRCNVPSIRRAASGSMREVEHAADVISSRAEHHGVAPGVRRRHQARHERGATLIVPTPADRVAGRADIHLQCSLGRTCTVQRDAVSHRDAGPSRQAFVAERMHPSTQCEVGRGHDAGRGAKITGVPRIDPRGRGDLRRGPRTSTLWAMGLTSTPMGRIWSPRS